VTAAPSHTNEPRRRPTEPRLRRSLSIVQSCHTAHQDSRSTE
jgi:hypothetical protein